MTCQQVLSELKSMGKENIKQIFLKHGAREPLFGVKIEDLKKIQKKIKKNHALSLELYDTGNSDAMYLAGLIADEKKIGPKELKQWADKSSAMLCEYTVPWIAAESAHGYVLALEWIDSQKEHLQTVGWATLSSVVAIRDDKDLDLKKLKELMKRVEKEIHKAGNRTTYAMNGFIISVGCYVKELSAEADKIARSIGKVTVDMNGTACKVPFAPDYIKKSADKGTIGKKKKMARC
jgi:3-methyladenine DNA glycosylase AlkD